MEYRNLGNTGVKVSPLCLGTMMFGGRTSEADSIRIIHRAHDQGVHFIDTANINNYGSSLIYGHPQAPTGARLIMELIEELAILGGGYGLFTGCAAGDSASAVIVKVDVKSGCT